MMTPVNISEPLCMVTLPFWSITIVTGTVSDSDRPSADAVAVAVPVYVPASEEGCTPLLGDPEPAPGLEVPPSGLDVPPPVDVSFVLLLQPENTNNRVSKMAMPVFRRVKIFIFKYDFPVSNKNVALYIRGVLSV